MANASFSGGSCQSYNKQPGTRIIEPMTSYRKMWGPSPNPDTLAGATVANPQALADWLATRSKEVHTKDGRILWNGTGMQRLEIMALMTTASATVTGQLFSFDSAPGDGTLGPVNAALVAQPNKMAGNFDDYRLGLAYNMTQNLAVPADTMTLTAHATYLQQVSFVNECEPWTDTATGVTYYVSRKEVFSTLGLVGFMWITTAISAGTAVVLGRLY